ncbi:MAG: hypothetical protein M0O93_06315 [Bacteroidales bacterium]|nr:hypothetical protein [Bacteroidales bacterium]
MKKYILLLTVISVAFLSSCSVGRIKNLEMEENHAIVIAKINIIRDSTYLPNKWDIAWNNNGKYFANCDSNGYIYMKLPILKNSITKLYYEDKTLIIPANWYHTFLRQSDIYYIGDIVINWDTLESISIISEKNKDIVVTAGILGGAIAGGIAGAIAAENMESIKNIYPNAVIVNDNYKEATDYFKTLFPTDKIIKKALLNIKLDTIINNKTKAPIIQN